MLGPEGFCIKRKGEIVVVKRRHRLRRRSGKGGVGFLGVLCLFSFVLEEEGGGCVCLKGWVVCGRVVGWGLVWVL